MATFLYFIETPKSLVNDDDLRAAGLGYLAGEGAISCNRVENGPLGSPGGVVFSIARDGADYALYLPAEQTWRKGPGGRFCFGIRNGVPIRPADLRRLRVINGERVKLRDGNEWTIPIARSIVRGSTLPKGLVLGDDAVTWDLKELPEFVSICRDAEIVWNAFRQATNGEVIMDRQESCRIAVAALAINYIVSPIEISLLELLGQEEMWMVLRALIDANMVEEACVALAKKNQPSGT
jgi:hypothetical protein